MLNEANGGFKSGGGDGGSGSGGGGSDGGGGDSSGRAENVVAGSGRNAVTGNAVSGSDVFGGNNRMLLSLFTLFFCLICGGHASLRFKRNAVEVKIHFLFFLRT